MCLPRPLFRLWFRRSLAPHLRFPAPFTNRGWVRATAPPMPALILLAAYAVSAVSFVVALMLLYRLVELELGERYARPVLALVAFWPASFFFSAPYSESLFLALSVGVFYAARTDRFGLAAALCAGATATRPTGLVLLLPLAWMAWRAGRLISIQVKLG